MRITKDGLVDDGWRACSGIPSNLMSCPTCFAAVPGRRVHEHTAWHAKISKEAAS